MPRSLPVSCSISPIVAEHAHRQRHGLHEQTDDRDDDEELEEGKAGVRGAKRAPAIDPSSRCRH